MSTVVCQGFLDQSHLMETTTMRLKVVTPKSLESSLKDQNWNFLQSLNSNSSSSSSSPQTPKKSMELELESKSKSSMCIPPLNYKQSSILLSEKSLELCTESLGSETGSDTSESSILSLSLFDSSSNGKSIPREERNLNSNSVVPVESRKFSPRRSFSFPPPLTTISGSNSLQVKPHREGGRLILQAMEAPSTHSYFQTERSEGRLKLSFWKDMDYNFDSKVSSSNEECEESHDEDDEVVHVENDNMINDERPSVEEEVNEFEKESSDLKVVEKEEGTDYDEYVKMIKGMDGIRRDVEVGMGMEKFGRRRGSRCKEDGHGDKGLGCNWEAFWVAT